MMKKVLIVACIALIGFFVINTNKDKKTENDYEKIEKIQSMCETIAQSEHVYSFGSNNAQWYILELELIHTNDSSPYSNMEEILGEDFKTKLSNGDKIFVGFLPYRNSFRIYAGVPEEANMIYPDWNYTKLEKK